VPKLPSTRAAWRRVVEQSSPLLAREVEVQPTQWPDAPNSDGNLLGHSKDDAPVQEDPAAARIADVDQGRLLVSSPAPAEPHITNVTSATTPTVFVRDNERILAWVLVQPAAGFVIERHVKGFAHHLPAGELPPLPLARAARPALLKVASGRAAAELGDIAGERLSSELHAFGHGQVRVEGLGEIRDGEVKLDGVHRGQDHLAG